MVLTQKEKKKKTKKIDWSSGLGYYETPMDLKVFLKRAFYIDLWFSKSCTLVVTCIYLFGGAYFGF